MAAAATAAAAVAAVEERRVVEELVGAHGQKPVVLIKLKFNLLSPYSRMQNLILRRKLLNLTEHALSF